MNAQLPLSLLGSPKVLLSPKDRLDIEWPTEEFWRFDLWPLLHRLWCKKSEHSEARTCLITLEPKIISNKRPPQKETNPTYARWMSLAFWTISPLAERVGDARNIHHISYIIYLLTSSLVERVTNNYIHPPMVWTSRWDVFETKHKHFCTRSEQIKFGSMFQDHIERVSKFAGRAYGICERRIWYMCSALRWSSVRAMLIFAHCLSGRAGGMCDYDISVHILVGRVMGNNTNSLAWEAINKM